MTTKRVFIRLPLGELRGMHTHRRLHVIPLMPIGLNTPRRRLDDMHHGIARYLKRLTYAPLNNPTRILELGFVDFHSNSR